MGQSSIRRRRPFSEINVTPFVDVMLVLLVIFMVTAPLMVTGMQVELPQADAPPLESTEQQMVLTVDIEGRYYINETELSRGPGDQCATNIINHPGNFRCSTCRRPLVEELSDQSSNA